MQKLLSGAVQMKYTKMIAWRKQVNFPRRSWNGVAYHLKGLES